jgi:hypothetical protein
MVIELLVFVSTFTVYVVLNNAMHIMRLA